MDSAQLKHRRATPQPRVAYDLVRLWPKSAPFALVELMRVVLRIRQDIDARGALPLNLRRLPRLPVSRFLLVCRRLQRFLERWFRA